MPVGSSSISWGRKIPMAVIGRVKAGAPILIVPKANVALGIPKSSATAIIPIPVPSPAPAPAAVSTQPIVEMGAVHDQPTSAESIWTVSVIAMDPSGRRYIAEFDAVFPEGSCMTGFFTKRQ